jgi:hypothetical protein
VMSSGLNQVFLNFLQNISYTFAVFSSSFVFAHNMMDFLGGFSNVFVEEFLMGSFCNASLSAFFCMRNSAFLVFCSAFLKSLGFASASGEYRSFLNVFLNMLERLFASDNNIGDAFLFSFAFFFSEAMAADFSQGEMFQAFLLARSKRLGLASFVITTMFDSFGSA